MHYPLTGEQSADQIELLVGEPAAAVDIETEMLVFLRPITDSEDHRGPPVADDVEHREVLGKTHGIVERQDHDEAEKQSLSARCDRGSENDR